MPNASAGVQRVLARLRRTTSERTATTNPSAGSAPIRLGGSPARIAVLAHLARRRAATRRVRADPWPHPVHVRSTGGRSAPAGPAQTVLRADACRAPVVRADARRSSPRWSSSVPASSAPARLGGRRRPVRQWPGSGPRGSRSARTDALPHRGTRRPVGASRPGADDGRASRRADHSRPTASLSKPVAVDTVVADGKDLLETYKVQSGDTLTGIASHYGDLDDDPVVGQLADRARTHSTSART